MTLVQLVLPLYDNDGRPFPPTEFHRVRAELTERFGGATGYTRAPAEGTWEDPSGRVHHDDVIVVEVMAESLDRAWWAEYRRELSARFRQESILVRALPAEQL